MASISLPQRPVSMLSEQLSTPASDYRKNRLPPLPNPPFVFPAREPESSSSTTMENESSGPPPLPAFSFNPGLGHSSTASTVATAAPGRAAHRRRATEFSPVSGAELGTTDNSSTLPTPGPGLSAAGPGRRGHAHRRSAAISSMDLTAVTKAFPGKPLVGSAPSTPSDMKHDLDDELARPTSRSVPSPRQPSPPASPAPLEQVQDRPPSRQKVEFAERTTVIPRPLSTISAETSSSFSTIRPTQSTTSNASTSTVRASTGQSLKPRPKTADSSLAFLLGTAKSEEESRRASFSDLQTPTPDGWEETDPRSSKSVRTSSDSDCTDTTVEDESEPKSKHKFLSKAEKRQKKVRSWAGAILGKSKKSKKSPKKTPPPPPVIVRTNSEVGSLAEVDFDEDNTVIIRTPTNPNSPRPPFPALQTRLSLDSSWKPKSFYEQNVENDMFSPAIDLDAALGPFNTPEMSSDRVAGSSFSVATRRMYSGGRRGEFVGPEMRYHRRSESAPEMPPFDRSSLATRFGGSNPSMAVPDVFYEEEEDAFLAGNNPSPKGLDASKKAVESRSAEKADESSSGATVTPVAVQLSGQDQGLGIKLSAPNERNDAETATKSVESQEDVASGPKSPVKIVQPDDYHQAGKFDSPDVSPRFVPADKRPPADLPYDIPRLSLTGDTPVPSAFPSPDPFEAPRSATASSSTTDRNVSQSLYSNDPQYPQGSVEDVPSLTSSASTMTRFSNTFYKRPQGERAASYSDAVPRRSSASHTAKRSSLASLSKLVVGSHGEKSKLSYEMKAPRDEAEKLKKKGSRISRLMHFWKSREKDKHKVTGD